MAVPRAATALELSRSAAAARLGALARQGWLKRVRRGLYLVMPLESTAATPVAVEDPWVLAREVYAPCYIGGWTAAEYWELTEQIFRSTFVVTAALVRATTEEILGSEFRLVHVAHARLKGSVPVWRGKERVGVSDRERTIADALLAPEWVGGLRQLVTMLRAYRESDAADFKKVESHLSALGRGAGFKRFGYLLETIFPEERVLIERALGRRSEGLIRLDPSVRTRGKILKRWGLWVNVEVSTGDE